MKIHTTFLILVTAIFMLIVSGCGSQKAASSPPVPEEDPYDVSMKLGTELLQKKNLEKAMLQFEKAISLKPNDPEAARMIEKAAKLTEYHKTHTQATLLFNEYKYDQAITLLSSSENLQGESELEQQFIAQNQKLLTKVRTRLDYEAKRMEDLKNQRAAAEKEENFEALEKALFGMTTLPPFNEEAQRLIRESREALPLVQQKRMADRFFALMQEGTQEIRNHNLDGALQLFLQARDQLGFNTDPSIEKLRTVANEAIAQVKEARYQKGVIFHGSSQVGTLTFSEFLVDAADYWLRINFYIRNDGDRAVYLNVRDFVIRKEGQNSIGAGPTTAGFVGGTVINGHEIFELSSVRLLPGDTTRVSIDFSAGGQSPSGFTLYFVEAGQLEPIVTFD